MRRGIVLLFLLIPLHAAAQPAWLDGFGAPPVGNGLDGDPRALLHVGDEVYCGGSFSQAGDQTAWFVARLEKDPDGSRFWVSLGDLDNRVDALCAWGDSVLAGGRFTVAGGVAVNRVAVFDGWAWHAVGDPADWTWGHVSAVAMHDGTPWAAGSGFVVRWTGSAWEAVTGSGFTGDVFALASFGGSLVAGGAFSSITSPAGVSTAAANAAAWDGAWSALGGGLNGTCYALAAWSGKLVAGGVFTSPQPLVAAWTGAAWTAAGPALVGTYVTALEAWGPRLIAGGDLDAGGGTLLSNLGYLDGAVWHDLGGGTDGMVRAISADLGEVVVGGSFGTCGGLPAAHVGVWRDPTVGIDGETAAATRIVGAFPNPFNPATTLAFDLARAGRARVSVYALDGRWVATLVDGNRAAGRHEIVWRGVDDRGRSVAAGSYLVKLEAGDKAMVRRITLLK